jgi:hypothetical protein
MLRRLLEKRYQVVIINRSLDVAVTVTVTGVAATMEEIVSVAEYTRPSKV